MQDGSGISLVEYFDSGAKDFTFWEKVLTRLRTGSIATCFV